MVPYGDQIRHPGSPGLVLGIVLTNLPHEKKHSLLQKPTPEIIKLWQQKQHNPSNGTNDKCWPNPVGSQHFENRVSNKGERKKEPKGEDQSCLLECMHYLSDYPSWLKFL